MNRLILASAVAVLAHDARAQDSAATKARTAALAGMVRDAFGHALKDAAVSVDKTELKAFTNDSGLFFLPGIQPGNNDFSVLHVGYAAVHFRIDLSADSTLVVNIPMKSVQTLPGVDVKGEQVSAKLMRAGYYERRNIGLGSYIGPEKIEKLQWSLQPSTFLRDTRGVRVICRSGGLNGCQVIMGDAVHPCRPTVYVNGSKRTGEFDQVVDVGDVYAIETYERRVLVPSEYQPADCVIGVWTKTFADVPQPPKKK